MKLSIRTDYAFRALVEIAMAHKHQKYIAAKEISERESIPVKFLEQILASLKKSGFVISKKGTHGGYTLARPPSEITFGEVICSLEGSTAPIGCVDSTNPKYCSELWHCRFHLVMAKLRDAISGVVDNTTLADICE